jgi:hypothetical protein
MTWRIAVTRAPFVSCAFVSEKPNVTHGVLAANLDRVLRGHAVDSKTSVRQDAIFATGLSRACMYGTSPRRACRGNSMGHARLSMISDNTARKSARGCAFPMPPSPGICIHEFRCCCFL